MMSASLKNQLTSYHNSESIWVQSSRSESSTIFNNKLNKALKRLMLEDKLRHYNPNENVDKKIF